MATEQSSSLFASEHGAQALLGAVEHAPVGIGVCDEDGRFVFVNAAVTDILSRDSRQLLGRPFLTFVHPDDRGAALNAYFGSVVAANMEPARRLGHGRLRAVTGEGTTIVLEVAWAVTPPVGSGGQLAVVYLADLTRRDRLEAGPAGVEGTPGHSRDRRWGGHQN